MTEQTESLTGWCNDGDHRRCRRPYTCPCPCPDAEHGAERRCEVAKVASS